MRLFSLLNVALAGWACAHSVLAAPISGPLNGCSEYSNSQNNAVCKRSGEFNLASVNQDLKVIYGSSGTLSIIQPNAIIAPTLDTSVVDVRSIAADQDAKSRLKNVRPKLRPENKTFHSSHILNVLDAKGRLDLSECLHAIQPPKQIALFPNRIDDLATLKTLVEKQSAWKQVTANLFGRKHDEGFCVDYLSLILAKS